MVRRWIVLAVAGAALLVVGCGGDDGEESATASPQEKAKFVKQAEAVCQKKREGIPTRMFAYQEENGGLEGTTGTPALYAETVQAVLLPIFESELEELRELDLPEGDEEQVEAILDSQEESIEEVAGLQGLSSQEGKLEAHFLEGRALMREYGIDACIVR